MERAGRKVKIRKEKGGIAGGGGVVRLDVAPGTLMGRSIAFIA